MLEIVEWEKFNPRKDVSKPSWFRMENDIVFDDAFYDFCAEELWVFTFLLSLASKKNTNTYLINIDYLSDHARVTSKLVISTIEKLLKLQGVRVHQSNIETPAQGRTATQRDETDITRHNETQHNTSILQSTIEKLDLEKIYILYPRKEGKSGGLKKLAKEKLSPDDFEKLICAVENYALSRRNEDPKFTKHFSTWVSEWRDWVDFKTPEKIFAPHVLNIAEKREAANRQALDGYLKKLGEAEDEQTS